MFPLHLHQEICGATMADVVAKGMRSIGLEELQREGADSFVFVRPGTLYNINVACSENVGSENAGASSNYLLRFVDANTPSAVTMILTEIMQNVMDWLVLRVFALCRERRPDLLAGPSAYTSGTGIFSTLRFAEQHEHDDDDMSLWIGLEVAADEPFLPLVCVRVFGSDLGVVITQFDTPMVSALTLLPASVTTKKKDRGSAMLHSDVTWLIAGEHGLGMKQTLAGMAHRNFSYSMCGSFPDCYRRQDRHVCGIILRKTASKDNVGMVAVEGFAEASTAKFAELPVTPAGFAEPGGGNERPRLIQDMRFGATDTMLTPRWLLDVVKRTHMLLTLRGCFPATCLLSPKLGPNVAATADQAVLFRDPADEPRVFINGIYSGNHRHAGANPLSLAIFTQHVKSYTDESRGMHGTDAQQRVQDEFVARLAKVAPNLLASLLCAQDVSLASFVRGCHDYAVKAAVAEAVNRVPMVLQDSLQRAQHTDAWRDLVGDNLELVVFDDRHGLRRYIECTPTGYGDEMPTGLQLNAREPELLLRTECLRRLQDLVVIDDAFLRQRASLAIVEECELLWILQVLVRARNFICRHYHGEPPRMCLWRGMRYPAKDVGLASSDACSNIRWLFSSPHLDRWSQYADDVLENKPDVFANCLLLTELAWDECAARIREPSPEPDDTGCVFHRVEPFQTLAAVRATLRFLFAGVRVDRLDETCELLARMLLADDRPLEMTDALLLLRDPLGNEHKRRRLTANFTE